MTITTNFFAGERFLTEIPPNYDEERISLIVKLILVFGFWTLVVPLFMAKDVPTIQKQEELSNDNNNNNHPTTAVAKKASSSNAKTKHTRGKRSKKGVVENIDGNANNNGTAHNQQQQQQQQQKTTTTEKVIDPWTNMYCIIGLIIHVLFLMLKSSPDNYYTTRSVFETPLFTDEECQYVVDMAERVAQMNYQTALNNMNGTTTTTTSMDTTKIHDLLQEPYGWQKKRHNNHPTTDLNLVIDPFTKEDRQWIQHKLDARLAPTLQRIFGIPPSSIRANDIFIIRYDGDRQASLEKHTDSGSITFSALLTDGFQGGGTKYYNRFKKMNFGGSSDNSSDSTSSEYYHLLELDGDPFAYVLPEKGMMQTFPGIIQHEGVQTEEGRRYLLIGFLDVDRVDPWNGHSTGLSWFASWGSLNWATTKVKNGWKELTQSSSHYLRELFMTLQEWFVIVGELAYEHRFVVLVNKTDSTEYLDALDAQYEKTLLRNDHPSSSSSSRGSWFLGQQINVRFDGSVRNNWSSRNNNQDMFDEVAAETR